MTKVAEQELAQTHTEHYVQGIAMSEAHALAFGRKVLHRNAFPLIFENPKVAAVAEEEIRLLVGHDIDFLVTPEAQMFGEGWSDEELMALDAGAKAGYEHRVLIEGEK